MFTKLDDKDTAPSRSVGELGFLQECCAFTEVISTGQGRASVPACMELLSFAGSQGCCWADV